MKNIILFLSLISIVSCNNNKTQEKFTRLTRGSVEILDERGKDFDVRGYLKKNIVIF